MQTGTDERFDCTGIDLARPLDSIKPGKYPLLQNVRSYTPGQISPRLGLTDLGEVVAGQSPVHSIRRLNDPATGLYTYILGSGTHVATGVSGGPYTDINGAVFSGNPLATMPYRPESSTAAWMYIADSARMVKISRALNIHPIGLAPPTAPPTVALTNVPVYGLVDSFQATAGWGQAGTAGAPALVSRVNTTITAMLYDSGTTGWASIVPATSAGIGEESLIVIDAAGTNEVVAVQAVRPGAAASTIASIIYDSGVTGLCSIVLATPVAQALTDSFIQNATLPENARIVSVTPGPSGVTSIRLATTGTWAVGNTVQLFASFRAYTTVNHVAGQTLTRDAVRTAVTNGTGTLSKTSALNLSLITTGVTATPDDYMHISMRVSDPTAITELKVLLDVDGTTNDFTRNYYWRSFRASDLTPAASNLQSLVSTRQTIIQRRIIDQPFATPEEIAAAAPPPVIDPETGEDVYQYADFTYVDPVTGVTYEQRLTNQQETNSDSSSQQLEAGVSQWVELIFRLSDMIRVGTDDSRTLRDVAAIRMTALVTANVNIDLDSWWIGGGYGPDSGDSTATTYSYRYRARVLSTNAASNFSPASRYKAAPFRQSVTVAPPQYVPSASDSNLVAATDIVLDIERFGGQLPSWHYAGTTPNVASPSFVDILADDAIAGQPTIGNGNFQPWPVITPPASGATVLVSGTSLTAAVNSFSTQWAPGTIIKVGRTPYTIYRVISTAQLETVENMGSQGVVAWEVDEPVLQGQPLPCLWGDEEFGAAFACGDPYNPGRLYYTNGFNPDSTVERNYLDVTSPSEPLQNGLIWNGRSYLFSSERGFEILKTTDPDRPYYAQEIPGTGGMFSRWGMQRNPHAPWISLLGKDGINRTTGGIAESMTDDDLYPIFPHEGNLGTLTNSVSPPNMIAAQASNLRMEWYDNYLYFDYTGVSGLRRTLLHDLASQGWYMDVYPMSVQCHYGEEGPGVHGLLCGGADGRLYRYAGNSDNGTAIPCVVHTPSRDQGAPRIQKFYTDCLLDIDAQGVSVSVTPTVNNQSSNSATVATAVALRTQVTIPVDSGVTARNIALQIVFNVSTAARPVLYIWSPRWAPETAPLYAKRWTAIARHFGMPNYKHIGTCKVTHVSTANLSLVVTVDGVVQVTITVAHSSGAYMESYFRIPVMKGRLYAFDVSSSADFRLAVDDTWFEMGEWDRGESQYQKVPVFAP